MEYWENPQQSAIYANAAIDTMAREGIAATPPNFMIWYSYHEGQNSNLSRTIDVLLSNRQRFTAERNAERFFGADADSAAV